MSKAAYKAMQQLVSTRAYYGSKESTSYFQPYLYGFRNEIAIINLEHTLVHLRRACKALQLIHQAKGHIFFVNTNPEYNALIQHTAILTGHSYLNHKWVGGLLTNWQHMQQGLQVFKQVSNYLHTKQSNNTKSSIALDQINHKSSLYAQSQPSFTRVNTESLRSAPRLIKMQRSFEGLSNTRPDCIVVLSANDHRMAIYEATQANMPIISLIDSHTPNRLLQLITYPIAANESSFEFVYLCCNCVVKSLLTA